MSDIKVPKFDDLLRSPDGCLIGVVDSRNPVIEFYPWEYKLGFQVGATRFVENWGRQNAAHYEESKMEEDRNAQPAAVLCEIAVARYLNQYCHCHIWHSSEKGKYKHLADVGNDIEVRRVRTGNAVKVRVGDAGKVVWGVKLIDAEHRAAEILGCIPADDVIESLRGTYQDEKYVEIDVLQKPWETR